MSEYAGTYTSPGFGTFTICAPGSTSSTCRTVLDDFRTADRVTGNISASGTQELYAAWPRFWSSHLRFIHDSGDCFAFESTNLYPDGYGADKTPFANPLFNFHSSFLVEKGKVAGFGFYVSLHQSWRSKKGGSVRDTADVWFDKVA
jgi:hypothetical protein